MDKKTFKFFQTIIQESSYYSPWAKKEELKKIKNENNFYLTTQIDGKIVGAVNGYYDAGMFWVDWLVVDPDRRRNGIGQKLMERIEKKLKREGIHKIWCDSRTSNAESKSLLVKLGYKKITTIKNHWYKQNFILWQKLL